MLQELVTVQPTYGRHYAFQYEPAPFPEAWGEIPPYAIPGESLLIRGPKGVYEISVILPKDIKPGDTYHVTWNVENYRHTILHKEKVAKKEMFPVMLPDGSNIQVQNLTNQILNKGDTIDVWVQRHSVNFTPNFTKQPANDKFQKQQKQEAKTVLQVIEARTQLKKCEKARKELEEKLKTCENESTSLL